MLKNIGFFSSQENREGWVLLSAFSVFRAEHLGEARSE